MNSNQRESLPVMWWITNAAIMLFAAAIVWALNGWETAYWFVAGAIAFALNVWLDQPRIHE